MDGTEADVWAAENAIAGTGSVDLDAAINAWEATWLAAAALRTRIDGGTEAARRWLRAIPRSELERAAELEEELGMVTASLDARWRSLVDIIADAGTRLATRAAEQDRRRQGVRTEAVATETTPRPAAAAAVDVPAAVPVAVRPPDRVALAVAPEIRGPMPATPRVAPAPRPIPVPAPRSTARPAAVPATRATPRPPPQPPTRPRPAPRAAPTLAEPAAAAPAAAVVAPLPTSAGQVRAAAGNRGRRRGIAAAALVVAAGVVLTGALLAGTIGPFARDPDGAGDREGGLAAVVDGGTESPSASMQGSPLASATGSDVPPTVLLTIDEHEMGPLDPEKVPITRVAGVPEVVAFPSAFDRSLRMAGPVAGICVERSAPPRGSTPSVAFDIHLGDAGEGGRLAIGMAASGDAPALGMDLDLATLAGLDRADWYRLTATARDGDGRPLLEADVGTDVTIVPASANEVCLQSSLQEPDASLLIDNLRVDG